MRWHLDALGDEWTATVTPHGSVRIMRRVVKPPYREGGDNNISYDTFEFAPKAANGFARTIEAAVAAAPVEKDA